MYPPWRELKFILCRVYGITGGGGFLGYRLALMLLADYNDVFIKLLVSTTKKKRKKKKTHL